MKMKCLIVEDEPLAVCVLKNFIDEVPFLELAAVCTDALYAMQILKEQEIDLMFLDINLPKLNGLEFLKTLKNPPNVIITTAYHEFAVQSYEYDVLDYLMKPIEFSRFINAVQKILKINHSTPNLPKAMQEDLYFTVNKKKMRVPIKSILYIESQKENIKIVLEDKFIITRYSMIDLENQLPHDFLRIHRSFIISKSKIDFFDAQDVDIRGNQIPIGRNYRNFVRIKLGV